MIKLAFIDVETTGLDPKVNGILQISGIIRVPDSPEEKFTLRVQPFPEDVVEKDALAANKLDPKEGLLPNQAHWQLVRILGKYVNKYKKDDKFFFVGYNAQFDAQFLRSFFDKQDDHYFGSWFFNPPLDVMTLSLVKLIDKRWAMPNFKLGTVAKALGIDFDPEAAHGAEYDIQKTAEIYDKLGVIGGTNDCCGSGQNTC